MKKNNKSINYPEIIIFALILLGLVLLYLKVIPDSMKNATITVIGLCMVTSPLRSKKLVDNDERNNYIDLKSKAFAYNLSNVIFGALIIIFSFIHAPFIILLFTLFGFLILQASELLAFSYYHKNN